MLVVSSARNTRKKGSSDEHCGLARRGANNEVSLGLGGKGFKALHCMSVSWKAEGLGLLANHGASKPHLGRCTCGARKPAECVCAVVPSGCAYAYASSFVNENSGNRQNAAAHAQPLSWGAAVERN